MTLTELTFAEGATDDPSDEEPVGRDVDGLFDRFVTELRLLGDRELIRRVEGFERRLERERLVAAARVVGSSGDVASDRKRARGLLGGPGRSRRSTNRDARRAAAVAANPSLEAKVGDGSIAPDSLDALTKAADPDTGGIPEKLIDDVVGLSPGQTDHAVDRHLEDNADRDDVNDRHRRQMQARTCRRTFRPAGEGKPDMATMVLEGPDSIIDRIWNQVCASADAAYKTDGGRDRPIGEHVPLEHRLFDAAVGGSSTAPPPVVQNRPSSAVTLTTWCRGTPRPRAGPISTSSHWCGLCHRELHQRNLTLYRGTGPGGTIVWHTRPATRDETPPPRPQTIQRE